MTVPAPLDLLVSFNLGLASQVHCVGMCGGIVAALNFATAPSAQRGARPLLYALGYNAGRIASYALAGALVGALGGASLAALDREAGYVALRWVAGLVLVLNGLALAGWLPRGLLFEALGAGVWRHLQKLGRGLLPIASLPRAFAFGMVWGWLPCALVYSTLMFAASSAEPARAAAIMATFGAGTLPALVASYWLGARAAALFQGRGVRLAAAALLVLVGLAYPFIDHLLPGLHAGHAGHADHSQMDHSQMDHSQMDHSQMDHSQMDHGTMDHGRHLAPAPGAAPPHSSD